MLRLLLSRACTRYHGLILALLTGYLPARRRRSSACRSGAKIVAFGAFPCSPPQCTSVACGVPASPEEGAWCRARVVGEWARPRQAGALTVRALPRSPEPHHRYPPAIFLAQCNPSALPVQSRARFAGRAIEGAPRLLHSRRPSRPPLHRRRCPCQRFSFAPAPPSSSPSVR